LQRFTHLDALRDEYDCSTAELEQAVRKQQFKEAEKIKTRMMELQQEDTVGNIVDVSFARQESLKRLASCCSCIRTHASCHIIF
jgi:3-methyladenine DNA glycosylase AlkC